MSCFGMLGSGSPTFAFHQLTISDAIIRRGFGVFTKITIDRAIQLSPETIKDKKEKSFKNLIT